jgi:hypothetical protein
MSPTVKVLAILIAVVWVVAWAIPSPSGTGRASQSTHHPTIQEYQDIGGPPLSEAAIARGVALIFIGEIQSSEFYIDPPTGCDETCPEGVGTPYTRYAMCVDRVVKGNLTPKDVVTIRQFGGAGIEVEDAGPSVPLEIGKRYLVTANPVPHENGMYDLFQDRATEITSQVQEDALVAEFESYLDGTPGLTPSETPILPTVVPTEVELTLLLTDTPAPTETATATLEPTVTATEEPDGTPVDELAESESEPTPSPTETETPEP